MEYFVLRVEPYWAKIMCYHLISFLQLASSPGNFVYPAAPCLVTQRFFFKMADGVYQDKGNRAADRADQNSFARLYSN